MTLARSIEAIDARIADLERQLDEWWAKSIEATRIRARIDEAKNIRAILRAMEGRDG